MKRLAKDEKGQALIVTLLLLVIGSIIITPTLNFMGTGIMAGRVYEQRVDEIYAADSGVEDALWHIRNDLVEDLLGTGYDEYDYSSNYSYPYVLSVNDKDVELTLKNIWIPKDVPDSPPPAADDARDIIKDEELIIVGYPSSDASTYTIKIVYNWDTSAHRDALRVKKIGIWLSPGFTYTEYSGSCSLQSRPFYSPPAISPYKGGQAVVWTFASQPRLRQDFTPTTDTSNPLERTFTFKYTSPEEGQIPELVSSWIDTTGVSGITYTWDDSIRLYKIVSQAGGVQVEAYGAKTKFRKLKSTISSDYAVAGNTFMKATGETEPDSYARDRLYAETTSTLQRLGLLSIPPSGIIDAGYIPEEAVIDKVYLYWSGWIDYNYYYYGYGCGYDPWPWWKCWTGYHWGEITDLKYNSNTKAELMANSKVNMVKFDVGGGPQTIYADNYQIVRTADCSEAEQAWDYSCFKDVTNLAAAGNVTVREYIENAMKSAGSGTVTFTVGHANEVRGEYREDYPSYDFYLYDISQNTSYPLGTPAHKRPDKGDETYETRYQYAYGGWSLIIFYRSPALVQRQLYLYDDLRQVSAYGWPDEEEFIIAGFLAPPPTSENDKSHVTYFTGEGDAHYTGDSIEVNDVKLCYPPDAPEGPCDDENNPENNVFNSYSNAIPDNTTDGMDIDTFVLPDGCITPYSTSATVKLITTRDPIHYLAEMYTLVYLVVSFRSDVTTGGVITNYSVKIS